MYHMLYLFPLLVLACWQIVEVWNHGELFATLKAKLEAEDGILAQGLLCPFCMSNWVGLTIAYALVFTYHSETYRLHWSMCVLALFYGFAIARAANLCNDYFYNVCRTPGTGVPDMDQPIIDEVHGEVDNVIIDQDKIAPNEDGSIPEGWTGD